MSVEQEGIQPGENLVRQEWPLKITSPTTARELLGRYIREPEGLSLTSDPLYVMATRNPLSGSTEYAALIFSPLECERFIKFLYTVSPNPRLGPDRVGILADWKMSDEAEHDRYSKNLKAIHEQGLGKHWLEFERYRKLFINVLGFNPVSIASMFHFASYGRVVTEGKEFLPSSSERLLADGDENALREQFVAFLKNNPQLKKRNWMQEASAEDIIDRFGGWWIDSKEQLLKDFWRKLTFEDRERFLSNCIASGVGMYLPDVDPPGFVETYNNYRGYDQVDARYMGEGRIEIRAGNFFKGEALLKDAHWRNRWNWSFDPETIQSTNYLIPTVRWEKDRSGMRRLDLNVLEEPFATQSMSLVGNVPEGLEFDERRFNPLVGLLAVAYLMPDTRRGWPEDQGLSKDGRKQFMGPAQVPVLALQRSGQILRSDFFDRAETYLESTAV